MTPFLCKSFGERLNGRLLDWSPFSRPSITITYGDEYNICWPISFNLMGNLFPFPTFFLPFLILTPIINIHPHGFANIAAITYDTSTRPRTTPGRDQDYDIQNAHLRSEISNLKKKVQQMQSLLNDHKNCAKYSNHSPQLDSKATKASPLECPAWAFMGTTNNNLLRYSELGFSLVLTCDVLKGIKQKEHWCLSGELRLDTGSTEWILNKDTLGFIVLAWYDTTEEFGCKIEFDVFDTCFSSST